MKILYHHRTVSRDGQEVHISELVDALRRLGHQVTLVGPGDSGAGMGGHRGGMARLRAVIPDRMMPMAARVYETVALRKLVSRARQVGIDFVYERHALDNRVGVRAARRLGVPLLLEVNSPLAREEAAEGRVRSLDAALQREVETLNRADAVLVVTDVLKEILVEDGVAAERIHVIPNGVTPEWFSAPAGGMSRAELGIDDGRLVLGFIGFPRRWHALDRVVTALASAKSGPLHDAVLLIGGEGPALAELRRQAESLGVGRRVVCPGVLDRDRVMSFIDLFDIALQPASVRYASPLKLFEYLARGVAVIAPDQPNISGVVEDGRSAVLFDPDDDASFAAALQRLAGDDALRREVGAGGRSRLQELGYSWTNNAARVIEIAEDLMSRRST